MCLCSVIQAGRSRSIHPTTKVHHHETLARVEPRSRSEFGNGYGKTGRTGDNAMNKSVKDMLEAAEAAVPRISPEAARQQVAEHGALIVDVRDAEELARAGKAQGALHVSRGLLEFRADPDSPMHDPNFRRDRPVILYCAAGGRAALAGMALKELGYQSVFNLGSFQNWIDSGGAVDKPIA